VSRRATVDKRLVFNSLGRGICGGVQPSLSAALATGSLNGRPRYAPFVQRRALLARSQAAVERQRAGDVGVEPGRLHVGQRKEPVLLVRRQGTADRRLAVAECGVLIGEAIPELGSLQDLAAI
jgi:hypothetical protein